MLKFTKTVARVLLIRRGPQGAPVDRTTGCAGDHARHHSINLYNPCLLSPPIAAEMTELGDK